MAPQIPEHHHASQARHEFLQQFEPFPYEIERKVGQSCDVSARPRRPATTSVPMGSPLP